VLAGLSVFFTTLVAVGTGLRAADRTSLDLVTAYGGGRWMLLRKVRAVASLPSVFTGLQIAAPAALLGAIIGEYIGADSGLGVLMISSQQSMQIPRTWAVALLGALIAGVVYALLGLVGRRLLPWATELSAAASAPAAPGPLTAQTRPWWFRVGASVLAAIAGVAGVLLVWIAFLEITGVSSFIGRSPSDVVTFLTTAPASGPDTRGDLLSLATVTTRDALLGLLVGVAGALVVAAVFAVSDVVRSMFSGIVLSLRSVPMIAMTPLIVLVAGRGVGSVAVIGGLVTFFPTLVMVLDALQRVPKDSADLMAALGAGRWRTLVTVQLPMAVTGLLASLRIAAPLAFTGALLAEWLATGQGLGYDMILSMTTARYDMLWSEVVIVTGLSLVVFAGVGLLDRWAARMYAGGPIRIVESRRRTSAQEVMA
jgi:ABC-type nitrate/sulfonate/bicarbonate transport system permease component